MFAIRAFRFLRGETAVDKVPLDVSNAKQEFAVNCNTQKKSGKEKKPGIFRVEIKPITGYYWGITKVADKIDRLHE